MWSATDAGLTKARDSIARCFYGDRRSILATVGHRWWRRDFGAAVGWVWAHKWSSLICTAFLLVLCVTDLPLLFADHIRRRST